MALFLAIAVTAHCKSLRDKRESVGTNEDHIIVYYDEEIRSDYSNGDHETVPSVIDKNEDDTIMYDEEIRSDSKYPTDYIDEGFKKPNNGFSKLKPCRPSSTTPPTTPKPIITDPT